MLEKILKIMGGIIAVIAGIAGLVTASFISKEVGSVCIVFLFIFILCFQSFSHEVELKFIEVSNRLLSLERKRSFTKVNSPVKLNDEGVKALSESGAFKIVDDKKNKKKILDLVLSDPKPTNAYDAQEKTVVVMDRLANDKMFLPIKDYAFNKGLDMPELLYAMAIYFRKYVLEELNFDEKDCDNK